MEKRIIGIYLAAGKSLRFGRNKLAQHLKDQPLGSLALQTVLQSSITHTVVVCSCEDPLIWITDKIEQLRPALWDSLLCKSLQQSYSLKAGLQKAQFLRADAVIVFLADQPFISTALIEKLIDVYMQLDKNNETPWFISSGFGDASRPPVLITPAMFPYLFRLRGDRGARSLIQMHREKGKIIKFNDPDLFF
ncbi:NTP transferase domain-containing protein [Virgibacillus halophilus]|uniref:NTP transferase domain-containing protein n=2 Tax=Tigheibacillus halophilus TaxID=361280 RepID=A0ABU5CB18_9BACI|nr:NTP transferase domain-containing protein [Virgibacillus halophilus]